MSVKPVTILKIKALLHKGASLTDWELRFIKTLEPKIRYLTHKQKIKIDEMYAERVRGIYTGIDHSISYDDVHDFDRE